MGKKEKDKVKGKGKIIIIILLLIVLGAGGFFGYRIFAANNANKKPATTTDKSVSTYTFGLDEVLVNLMDEGSTRFIKIQVYIGYDNKKLTTELTENKAVLRDMVISVLRTKKAEDFSPDGIDKIKKELLSKINPLLSKGQATNIYFYDILVQ